MNRLRELLTEVLAIYPPALSALAERLAQPLDASAMETLARAFGSASRVRRDGDVAHVPVRGVLVRGRVDPWLSRYYGISGLDDIRDDVTEALADHEARTIVLDIDSPGGTAAGLQALADHIQEARRTKRVEAHVAGMAASAGYFVAAQAERIVSERDAIVGSIGTYARVVDASEMFAKEGLKVHVMASGPHKGMGTWGAPVTGEQLAMHQAVINDFAAVFVDAVAAGRGLEREHVQALATGAHWLAPAALDLKLIDAIGGAGSRNHPRRGGARAEETITMADSNSPPAAPAAQASTTTSAPAAPQGPRAATIAELEAHFPGEPGFALEQLKLSATLEQATNAFTRVKLDRAEASAAKLKAERDQAQAELAAAKASQPQQGGQKASSGVDPLPGNTATWVETPLAKSGDFVARARAIAQEKGITYTAAATQLAEQEPELHAAYVDRQHDESARRRRRGGRGK
ncbi:MAG: S49 family peptidase [Planctomycetes bacterium]|nr:S49 family peptidase [Planctomycetota bacterium]